LRYHSGKLLEKPEACRTHAPGPYGLLTTFRCGGISRGAFLLSSPSGLLRLFHRGVAFVPAATEERLRDELEKIPAHGAW
jgi:hypothetical protein